MGVSRLEHVNIRCARLAATKAFYIDIIGLSDGARLLPLTGIPCACGRGRQLLTRMPGTSYSRPVITKIKRMSSTSVRVPLG